MSINIEILPYNVTITNIHTKDRNKKQNDRKILTVCNFSNFPKFDLVVMLSIDRTLLQNYKKYFLYTILL